MSLATLRAALVAVCLLPTAWGCAASRPAEVRSQASAGGVHHTVESGQTIWRIARTYGISVEELARANGIDDPASVEAGRRLYVPGATSVLEVPAYPSEAAFAWPVPGGRVISYYGAPRRKRQHQGLDIAGRGGEAVLAASDGRVVYSGSTMRGYGKTVIVDHGDGLQTLYAHGSTLLVREGDRVRRGQRIARVGRSGNASTEHCHFEVRRNDVPVDPMRYVTAER